MEIQETPIEGLKVITPRVFGDERGFFVESFQNARYQEILGPDAVFVQDNISRSQKGVLRGLHFQKEPHTQGKLVSVIEGSVFDVAVDIREDSATYGQWCGIELHAPHRNVDGEWEWKQFWIPPGFAHGFMSMEDNTVFAYKCTDIYAPDCDAGMLWSDPEIGIVWPDIGVKPTTSKKDEGQPSLKDISH